MLATVLWALPCMAQAWWNDDWAYRKPLTVDTTASGADIKADLADFPVLVRLHTGNFGYFLDLLAGGADLRFVAADDKTPLKYHIEKFDAVNEMALIWVKLPKLTGAAKTQNFYMYYSNPKATSADDAAGVYDVDQALVYPFGEPAGGVNDSTAYVNNATQNGTDPNAASLIGGGAHFNGKGVISVAASPSLRIVPDHGWTFSTWVKIDAAQKDAYLLHVEDGARSLIIGIDGSAAYARVRDAGTVIETPRKAELSLGAWHQLAVSVAAGRLVLYLDGNEVATAAGVFGEIGGVITLGGTPTETHRLVADVDEVEIAKVARSPEWIKASARVQGTASTVLAYGEDARRTDSGGASTSYFITILHNVTLDGWVIILLLTAMALLSWVIMLVKGVSLGMTRQANDGFLEHFKKFGLDDAEALNHAQQQARKQEHAARSWIAKLTDKIVRSMRRDEALGATPLYNVYQVGMQELRQRMGNTVGAQAVGLKPQSITAIRTTLDAVQIRETQKLNNQMVLLTIAISGGPFLGLLGTVVGVMITFAAIAASGDVNVTAIAPGIAAALVATVAGLGVAIPALFGYNYFATRIKDIVADMHVFVDEFVSKMAEQHGSAGQGD